MHEKNNQLHTYSAHRTNYFKTISFSHLAKLVKTKEKNIM